MAQQLKFRRGTTAQTNVFTGSEAELSYDTEKKAIVTHDGSTVGGFTGGGFLQSGSGAEVRSVESKLKDMVSVKDYGAAGDGITDDTAAIQAAINANDAIYFPTGIYIVTSPLYMPQRKVLKGDGSRESVIKKTTTTVGTGSNTSPSLGGVTDSYAVDAILIITHTNGQFAYDCAIYDMRLQGNDSFTTAYGVYAPRISQCIFQNVNIRYCITGWLTYDGWQISFNRITIDAEKMRAPLNTYTGEPSYGPTATCRGFYWALDGGGGGTGTSVTWNCCYTRRVDYGYDINNLSYSTMISCAADQINRCAYDFQSCRNLNLIGCASEQSIADPLLEFSGGQQTVIGFNAVTSIYGTTDGMYKATDGASVTFIQSELGNFSVVGTALNRVIQLNSHVNEIDTIVPTNGNSYISYSSGSTLRIHQNSDIRFNDADTLRGVRQRQGGQYFKNNKDIASAGTNIATITVTGSGTQDYFAGKLKIVHRDTAAYPDGIGYLEVPFSVFRTSTSYFQNVGSSISSIAGNAYNTQPTVSLTRVGNVWTMKVTPAHGDMRCLTIEVEGYSDFEGNATFAWL